MIATGTVLVVLALYVAGTFLVAQWGERTAAGRRWAAHPLSYALGLTVYCTTWTYYGSVGRGATGGIAYLPVYLGPTLAMLLGSGVLERMAALKRAHRLTSVADFISARYGKSEGVAALVTGLLSIGIVPYLALQLKALNDTFALLTAGPGGDASMVQLFGPACAVAMVVFTILFGLRHLDPTERHPGMVVSVAFEAVVKLTAFLASGALVLALVFDGPAGFFARLDELGAKLPTLTVSPAPEVLSWFTVTLLAAAASFFLPRQFHVGVVESSAPEHARFARWATPAYLLLINVLVLPIALGGASLALPGVRPDQFVLALPVHAGARALALFVFVGGFSAAIGMIMVEAMTMATMISNHLVLPVVARVPALRALERRVLPIRWTAVAGLVGAAYVFQAVAGGSSTLVAIGLISFAAAFLLAPVTLLGLFWREASKGGALVGLAAGGLTWFYTLMVPTFVKSQWLPKSLLDQGPWGIGLLRPEALMGWEGLPNLPHGVIFSALALLVGFVVGNALFPAGAEERLLTEAFLDPDKKGIEHLDARRRVIEAAGRRALARGILGRVFPSAEVDVILARCEQAAGIPADATHLTASEEAELHREVERSLAGAIGAPSAHHAMKAWGGIDRKDQGAVIREFARLIAEMRMSPRELKERIDAQGEKDAQLDAQFKELERRVEERTREIQTILNHVVFGFLVIDRALHVQPGYTRSCHELFGGSDLAGRRLDALLGVEGTREGASLELSIDAVFDDMLPEVVLVDQIPRRFPMPGGTVLHLEGRVVRDEAGAVVGVLVSVQDATLLEQTQAETKKQRVLLEILRNRGPFKTFIGDARVRLESALSLVGDPAQQVVVRREVHTLKGNAGAYGLDRIVAALHAIEEEPAIGADALRSVRGLFLEFLDENRAVLGMSLGEGEDEFVVRQAQLLELRDLVLQLPAPTSGPIVDWSRRVAQKPLAELLGPVDLVAAKLAERLEKDVRVVTAGLEVEVAPELWRPMSQALMHLVRNALDHGVETPDDRGTKPRQATLAIRAEVRGDEVALVLEDDGRGIDGWRLAQKAVSRGQLSPEAADALDEAGRLELMFLDGLSTAEQATDVSGRGVGMSAVRAEVERLGGRLEIRTVVGEGTAFSIVLPRYGLTADLVVGAAGDVVPRRDEARAPGA